VALAHDPPGPFSLGGKDQHVPAAIVPADIRACLVDGTVTFRGSPVIPEKGACLGSPLENTLVTKEGNLVRINGHRCFFPGVLVPDEEPVVAVLFRNGMDQSEMAAALTALAAFKRHSYHHDRYRVLSLLHLNPTGTGVRTDLEKKRENC